MIYEAQVVSVEDVFAGGSIQVVNTELNGGAPITCYAMTPFGGAGAGLFGGVGVGASVAITEIKVDTMNSYYAWVGVIYKPVVSFPTINENPGELTKEGVERSDTIDAKGKQPNSTDGFLNFGVPDGLETYEDNGIPGKVTFKSPGGHSISLYDKKTGETHKSGILAKTVLGKVLVLEDSPETPINGINPTFAKEPGSNSQEKISGNRIVLMDENGNRLVFHTNTSKGKNLLEFVGLEAVSIRAGKSLSIGIEDPKSIGDLTVFNYGNGSIEIKSDFATLALKQPGLIEMQGLNLDIKVAPNPDPTDTYAISAIWAKTGEPITIIVQPIPGITVNSLPLFVKVA